MYKIFIVNPHSVKNRYVSQNKIDNSKCRQMVKKKCRLDEYFNLRERSNRLPRRPKAWCLQPCIHFDWGFELNCTSTEACNAEGALLPTATADCQLQRETVEPFSCIGDVSNRLLVSSFHQHLTISPNILT